MGEYGPVVLEGRLRYLSPSQLQSFDEGTFGGCPRRWWFKSVAKKPERATRATDLGTKVHAQVEHYLKTGEDVLGPIARAGFRFIPRPGPDLLVELAFGKLVDGAVRSPLMSASVPFVGRIDLAHARGEWIDDEGRCQAESGSRDGVKSVEVVDWKSTARIANDVDEATGIVRERGLAKSGEELARTWQMLGYGVVGLSRWPDAKRVRASHGYFQTRGSRAASKRSAVKSADEVREGWAASEQIVERMKSAAGERDVERLPANYEACGSYGGCPHKAYCPRDPSLVLAEMIGRGGAMSLLGKIRSGNSATTPSSTPATPASASSSKPTASASPASAPPSGAVVAEIEKLKVEEAALKAKPKVSATPPDMPAPQKTSETAAAPVANATIEKLACAKCGGAPTRAIQGPDGMASYCGTCEPGTAPAETGPCPRAAQQVELTTAEAVSKKRVCDCGATVKVKPAEMSGKYYALIPKHDRPGTPKGTPAEKQIKVSVQNDDGSKTDITPKAEPEQTSFSTEARATEASSPTAPAPTGDPPATVATDAALSLKPWDGKPLQLAGIVLYLDALEDGVAPQRLEAYAEKLAVALAERFDVADVRSAPKDSPLAYGGYKGLLAAVAKAEPPAPGAYTVSSSSELGLIVFEALASKAARVVRGIR